MNKEEKLDYFKNYRKKNRDKLKFYQRKYRERTACNAESCHEDAIDRKQQKRDKEKERRMTDEYKKQRSLYMRKKYAADEQYRIKKLFESKVNRLLRNGDKKGIAKDLIGCSIEEFKQYIESKWLPTMSWETYGFQWNFDKLKPFIMFDLTDEEQRTACYNFRNTQPMFIKNTLIDGIEFEGNMNKNKF